MNPPYFVQVFPRDFAASFVGQFGWMSVPLPLLVHLLYGAVALASVLGLLKRLSRPDGRDARTLFAILFVLFAFAGIIYYNLTFSQSQGRHLFPALALVAVLAALGLRELMALHPRRVVLAMLVGLFIVADAVALFAMYRFYYADWGQYG